MLQITPPAIEFLVKTRDRKGFDSNKAARVAPSSNGISVRYGRSPEPDDKRIDGGDIDIYVANAIVKKFDDSIIDVAHMDKGKSLVIWADPFAT